MTTSIDEKLEELGIDTWWSLCEEIDEPMKCYSSNGIYSYCPAYRHHVYCHGSTIAQLLDVIEKMRACENCVNAYAYSDDCLSCIDYGKWKLRGT